MTPLIVEVLAPSLVGSAYPRIAGRSPSPAALAPGVAGSDDAYRLLYFLDRLRDAFDGRVVVHLIEPLSLAWLVRVVRYRPRRYPVFVVAGRHVVYGLDEAALVQTISSALNLVPTA